MTVARVIGRVEVRTGYKAHIKFRISLEQCLARE